MKIYEWLKAEAEHEEFQTIAARTMLDTDQNIKGAGYTGAVDKVATFSLQAKLSNRAYAGLNLVLAGDAVGAGHWSVGGGMHVAGLLHQQRLDVLATELLKDPDYRLNFAHLEQYQDRRPGRYDCLDFAQHEGLLPIGSRRRLGQGV